MASRKLMGIVVGLALLGGTVAVLRDEVAPPTPVSTEPVSLTRFLDERVDYRRDDQALLTPVDLTLTALDPSSLRVSWSAAGGLGHQGFEVRWHDQVRYVLATETELLGLDPDAKIAVEVRAVDAEGHRSEPARAEAAPRDVHDGSWDDQLVGLVDHFDGPETLNPRRWRVLGNDDCLGLRTLPDARRMEITCDDVELQSNVPLRLTAPAIDEAIGRVMLTVEGPVAAPTGTPSTTSIALLPEPFDDLPWRPGYDVASEREFLPSGAVILHITPQGASFSLGSGLPATSRVVQASNTVPLPAPGVRHRWELRVLPDAVVALRDGEVMAAAAVAVRWTSAHPRLDFHNAKGMVVDSFGIGGQPDAAETSSVIDIGPSLGNVPSGLLDGGVSARVVATVYANANAPVTMWFGDRSAPAKPMYPEYTSGLIIVYADFPLPEVTLGAGPKIRLTSTTDVDVFGAQVVVRTSPAAPARPSPRLTDRRPPEPQVARLRLTVVHDSGASPMTHLPKDGKSRLVVELGGGNDPTVAAIAGIEVDLDGERIVTLPTAANGPAVGGRYEFRVDTGKLSSGGHRVSVRVLPQNSKAEVKSIEQTFEIRAG